MKKKIKIIFHIFFNIFFNFFAYLLSLEIKFRSKFFFLYYFGYSGWNDNFCFFLSQYNNIKKKKSSYAIVWNSQNYEICKFLFPKKKILKAFFFIPKFLPHHKIEIYLRSKKNFTPIKLASKSRNEDYLVKNKESYKKLLKCLLDLKNYEELSFLKNYVCLYFRYHPKGTRLIRTSNNLQKCHSIIRFLIKNNLNIVLMGTKKEKYLINIKNNFSKEINDKKIYIAHEIIKDDSFGKQLLIMKNSLFFCGTQSGFIGLYYFLKKKAISFDGFYRDEFSSNSFSNIIYLFKKKKKGNSVSSLTEKNIKNGINSEDLIETSLEEIIEKIKTFLFLNNIN